MAASIELVDRDSSPGGDTPAHTALPRSTTPEYTASWLSILLFHWVDPLMRLGKRKTIEEHDLWLVHPDRRSDILHQRFKHAFRISTEQRSRHPLVWSLYRACRREFVIGGFCTLISILCQVFTPFIMRFLIGYTASIYNHDHGKASNPTRSEGAALVLAIAIIQIMQTLAASHYNYLAMVVGGMVRSILIEASLHKCLSEPPLNRTHNLHRADHADEPSSSGKQPRLTRFIPFVRAKPVDQEAGTAPTGEWNHSSIMTLMSVDIRAMEEAAMMLHLAWAYILFIVLVLVLLCVNIGYSTLAGYAFLVICLPLMSIGFKSLLSLRERVNAMSEKRLGLTKQTLGAIRSIKILAWENFFMQGIVRLRREEMGLLHRLNLAKHALGSVSASLPTFAGTLIFITYSLTGHFLDSALVFSSLALINSLRVPLMILPLVVGQLMDAHGATEQIERFLLAPDFHDESKLDRSMHPAMVLSHACFAWGSNSGTAVATQQTPVSSSGNQHALAMPRQANTRFELRDLSLTVQRHEILGVVGSVGSGKSCFLASLAGETALLGGSTVVASSRAFCRQNVWIQNATVRDNIVFGNVFDAERYHQVAEACCLTQDFEELKDGDQTEVGEKGVTLSGGQKQRVNLARAIYSLKDILLLDDPLSATDTNVGKQILEKAIIGLLRGKCRVIATHQPHVLARCDRVVWLKRGTIHRLDAFSTLLADSEEFRQLFSGLTAEKPATLSVVAGTTPATSHQEKKHELTTVTTETSQSSSRGTESGKQTTTHETDGISWRVWKAYARSSSVGVPGWAFVLFTGMFAQALAILASQWLSWWVSARFHVSTGVYAAIFASLGTLQAVFLFLFGVALSSTASNTSQVMLLQAMSSLLKAPSRFFDTTPIGVIFTRLSSDVDTMDNRLVESFRHFLFSFFTVVAVLVLISIYFPYFPIAIPPCLLWFYWISSFYMASATQVKKHEITARSDVFGIFSEAVSGITTIRSYDMQQHFESKLRGAVDRMNSALFLTFANQRWLSLRLDVIGILIVTLVSALAVSQSLQVSPNHAGLVLSYVATITQLIQSTVRQYAEVENNMHSTRRLHEYSKDLVQEQQAGGICPTRKTWPERGMIEFTNVEMKYGPSLPLVLRNLNLKIEPGSRVAIVGRTGAGKSSIVEVLTCLTDLCGGRIEIDGLDISKMDLRRLRSSLSVVGQSPILFQGTVRSNLDPFREHADATLLSALRDIGLLHDDANAQTKSLDLDFQIEEDGANLSFGQRQLVAFVRVMLQDSRVLVLDEATSGMDAAAGVRIQGLLRTHFVGRTVLCIAHHLQTILDYDKVCVLSAGQLSEIGSPLQLFDSEGEFWSLCQHPKITREDIISAQTKRS